MISIIVPVYNAEQYLCKCIDSILSQTYSNWELLLIDDGSKDSSGEICKSYSLKDKRIKTFSQKNSGPGAARNKGLDKANGEFIVFVDSDDWVDSNFLADYVKNSKFDIVYQGHYKETKEGVIAVNKLSFEVNKDYITEAIIKLWKTDYFGYTCMKMFRRDIIEHHHIRFAEGIYFREDTLFTAQYFQYVESVKAMPVANYHYRYIETSLQHTRFDAKEMMYVDEKIYACFSCYFKNEDFRLFTEHWFLQNLHNGIKKMHNSVNIKKLSEREHLDLIEKCLTHRKRYLPPHFLYSSNKLLNIMLKTIWFIGNPRFIHKALKILMR